MANHYPSEAHEFADLRATIEKHLLPGFAPPAPFLPRTSSIFTIGSCFAQTIHEALKAAGIISRHLMLAEAVNTPPCALLLLERLRGKEGKTIGHFNEDRIINPAKMFELRGYLPSASAFILTLGVALQPFHEDGLPIIHVTKSTVGPKWRTLGNSFHMLSVDEIRSYIERSIESIRAMRPNLPVILTLSPVPLMSSVDHPAPVVQDCISKSNIRAAIAMTMEEQIPDVYYWPSFEIVRWLGGHVGPFFGIEEQDQRHVAPSCVKAITDLFIERYFLPA
ncbi:MAG: GSCFA domain-containing protein [Rhodospirillaceae bacterium]